jgi:uncharacterized membrane protein YsdA (DUF1294 family)
MKRRLPFRPIVGGFLLAAAFVTALTAWLLADRLNWGALLAFLGGINLATFGAYLYDKSVARGEGGATRGRLWRVPETVLHVLALAGGTPAAFAGQKLLRHKTVKRPFRAWFWSIVVLQIAVLSFWIWYRSRN